VEGVVKEGVAHQSGVFGAKNRLQSGEVLGVEVDSGARGELVGSSRGVYLGIDDVITGN
jgi:hypothetical protein